jgi:hypothetical protein
MATGTSDLFHSLNDRIRELQSPLPEYDLVCECADNGCTRVMRMLDEEYDAAHAKPGQFAVVPGHELTFAHVLARTDRYVVVRNEEAA